MPPLTKGLLHEAKTSYNAPSLCPFHRFVVPLPRNTGKSWSAEFFCQEFVDHLWVRLALGLLHHLSDKRTDCLLIAALVVLNGFCVRRDDLIDNILDLLCVGDLDKPLVRNNLFWCVGRCSHLLEYGFADLRGNCPL